MKVPKIHKKIENNDYTQMYSFRFHGINRETVILHNNVKVSMLILKCMLILPGFFIMLYKRFSRICESRLNKNFMCQGRKRDR